MPLQPGLQRRGGSSVFVVRGQPALRQYESPHLNLPLGGPLHNFLGAGSYLTNVLCQRPGMGSRPVSSTGRALRGNGGAGVCRSFSEE